jgi:hypothetical protein
MCACGGGCAAAPAAAACAITAPGRTTLIDFICHAFAAFACTLPAAILVQAYFFTQAGYYLKKKKSLLGEFIINIAPGHVKNMCVVSRDLPLALPRIGINYNGACGVIYLFLHERRTWF